MNNNLSRTQNIKECVVLFDDICVLCCGTVNILTKLDKKRVLKYSSLQGKFGQALRSLGHLNLNESVVFWSDGKAHYKADAVIHILLKLGSTYKGIGFFLSLFPTFILNFIYDSIARSRYRIFGKHKSCHIPSQKTKDLFIP